MNKIILHNIKISFFISLAYVGLGTISVLSIYPSSPLYGSWVTFALIITLPVNFISVGIMYTDPTAIALILIVQLGYFLLFWFIVYRFLKSRAKKKDTTSNSLPPS
jgi:hypothetical protein